MEHEEHWVSLKRKDFKSIENLDYIKFGERICSEIMQQCYYPIVGDSIRAYRDEGRKRDPYIIFNIESSDNGDRFLVKESVGSY